MTAAAALLDFAARVRAARQANPGRGPDGSALELLIAPLFQRLVEAVLPLVTVASVRVLPEYRSSGIGRPDLALALPGSPARSFIELKAPSKAIEPDRLTGHDADQFRRFRELPLWAMTNIQSIRLYRRSELIDQAVLLAPEALEPLTSARDAERLARQADLAGFERILGTLAQAAPPVMRDPSEVAEALAHAARLVRAVVEAQCAAGLDPMVANVRADFNETLFARAEAGGYETANADALFASAFAQTLLFGLLVAREAGQAAVGANAYQLLPDGTYPLLRGALRALTMDETRAMLGAGFDVALDVVNAVDPAVLAPKAGGHDPMLYLYEDFLRVFDPEAVKRYGVYYTPPEVVRLIVACADRALRRDLGCDGLLDESVQLLDPACGTGTFLIAAANSAAAMARERFGDGAVGKEVEGFARRMHGFELLVGPYTVAHYRMLREVRGLGGAAGRLPIYLTDTLAPAASQTGVEPHLSFLSAPMVDERRRADEVKGRAPILVVIGNPPYKRLRAGEVARLVGADMDRRWQDLKNPVRDAGWGRALNAFPDLYVAFYRWSLWRLFEAEGATGRGVLAFITNRGFLAGRGFGGLRRMLRRRFDRIRVIDLRGDNRGAKPADISGDENVFNIEVGVCVLVASASGGDGGAQGEATVEYADAWAAGAFSRAEKLALCAGAAISPETLSFVTVPGGDMASLKPAGFAGRDWPAMDEVFTFRSNGIVTYRDDFVYGLSAPALTRRLRRWHGLPLDEAREEFHESAMSKVGPARAVPFDADLIVPSSYRPLDRRYLYKCAGYVDRLRPDLMNAWGVKNMGLFAANDGIGAGPAAWSHGMLPDQHAFRGSYGGWVFPLIDHAGSGSGSYLAPSIQPRLTAAYGSPITAREIFDTILALLSATSYTRRFARDLEDDFPHIPFPSDQALFTRAAEIGARLRLLQSFGAAGEGYRAARLVGRATTDKLDVPTKARAWVGADGSGSIGLVPDRSLRVDGVPKRVWRFSVSGYDVLYRWLRARRGETIDSALQREILDTVARLAEIVDLCDRADAVLADTLARPLTRAELGLPERAVWTVADEDEA